MEFNIECEKCLHKEVCRDKNRALKLEEKVKGITKDILGDFEIKVGCKNFLETAPIYPNQVWTFQGQYWCALKQKWCSRTGYMSDCFNCPYKTPNEWTITYSGNANGSEVDNPNSSSYARMEDLYKSGTIHPTGENKDAK